jgi:hypothetical protein
MHFLLWHGVVDSTRTHPNRPTVSDGTTTLTYHELEQQLLVGGVGAEVGELLGLARVHHQVVLARADAKAVDGVQRQSRVRPVQIDGATQQDQTGDPLRVRQRDLHCQERAHAEPGEDQAIGGPGTGIEQGVGVSFGGG